MNVDGKPMRTIWVNEDGWSIGIIDQTKFPHRFETTTLRTLSDAARAIKDMLVRGAPLIGATAAYGMALAVRQNVDLKTAYDILHATRPTAINLKWALDQMMAALETPLEGEMRIARAFKRASEICEEDVEINKAIGRNGLEIIREIAAKKPDKTVNILTHCNAGWLATVDWGTATALQCRTARRYPSPPGPSGRCRCCCRRPLAR